MLIRHRLYRFLRTARVRPMTLAVVLFVILMTAWLTLGRLDGDIDTLRASRAEAQKAMLTLESENTALRRELNQSDTVEYIAEQARKRYGYLMPGELRFEVTNTDALYAGEQSGS